MLPPRRTVRCFGDWIIRVIWNFGLGAAFADSAPSSVRKSGRLSFWMGGLAVSAVGHPGRREVALCGLQRTAGRARAWPRGREAVSGWLGSGAVGRGMGRSRYENRHGSKASWSSSAMLKGRKTADQQSVARLHPWKCPEIFHAISRYGAYRKD
jgi:hypothetical protein